MSKVLLPTFGVSGRLTAVITFIVALSLLSIAAFSISGLHQQLQARLNSEATDTITMSQKSLAQPLWTFDSAAINSTAEALLQSNQGMTKYVQILTPDNKVVLEKFSDPTLTSADLERMRKDPVFRQAEGEILFDNQVIGHVTVILSSESLLRELNALLAKVLWIGIISLLTVSSVLFFLVKQFISKPISGLVQMANEVKAGKIIAAHEDWPLEFGIISKAFSEASETIQQRDRMLRDYSEKLENQVEERTRKIDEQRMTLIESSRMASLGEMSAGIAHEINNPLAIISGKTMLLKRKIEAHPDFVGYGPEIEKVLSMVNRIAKIINGLRTFARDGSEDPATPFKVSKLFEDLKDLCHARLTNHGVTLNLVLEDPELELLGREVQISQVLINLVNNASDAIQNLEEKWITLSAIKVGQTIQLRVTDSGPGISPELQQKIMQPFFTTKEVGKGTGLGLSISLGIVRDHGGTLKYDEIKGHTSFVVLLPIADEVRKVG